MKNRLLFLVVISLILSFKTKAQNYKNEFGFKSENDSYFAQGSDRYYTNGLFINYRHAMNQERLKKGLEKKIYEISVGQEIYNSYSGYAPDPDFHDRPFAGYLYAGGAISWLYKKESILKVGVELGTTGPNSLAESGQDLLHNTIGFYSLDGWQYQIKNELSINFATQYTDLLYRSSGKSIDFSFEGYANAGTTFSGAGAGIIFRAGGLNQLFNSAYTNAVIGNNSKNKPLVKQELFFYAKPQLNLIVYDATIQGSAFNNNSPVTFNVKPIVFAQQLGFNYSSQRFTFDFGLIFKTREVKSTAKAHQYGSISMFYRFN